MGCNYFSLSLIHAWDTMGLLPDSNIAGCACAGNAGNVFPCHRLQRKPLVSDPDMHHGTCVTHVPWCMSGSLTRDDGENVPGIPGACATRNFTYLVRGPWKEWIFVYQAYGRDRVRWTWFLTTDYNYFPFGSENELNLVPNRDYELHLE